MRHRTSRIKMKRQKRRAVSRSRQFVFSQLHHKTTREINMKPFTLLVSLLLCTQSVYASEIAMNCSWPADDGGNYTFEFKMDKSQNTASAKLIDGISPGIPVEFDCRIQENIPSSQIESMLCTGSQLAPSVGQIIMGVMLDFKNNQAALQNTMVEKTMLTTISSRPAIDCN